MCGLCRLPGGYLEQLYANREEFIPEEITDDESAYASVFEPNWDLADPEYKQLLRSGEEHIIRGQE